MKGDLLEVNADEVSSYTRYPHGVEERNDATLQPFPPPLPTFPISIPAPKPSGDYAMELLLPHPHLDPLLLVPLFSLKQRGTFAPY